MSSNRFKILMALIFSAATCFAQKNNKLLLLPKSKIVKAILPNNKYYNLRHHLDDTLVFVMSNGLCKNRAIELIPNQFVAVKEIGDQSKQEKDPLLTIHGNILYNFNYRSYIDTPFTQTGMIQHMLQSHISGAVANKYPFQAVFTYRGSNSPYFSNNSDVSVQYRQTDMLEKVKSDLRKDADSLVDKNLLVNPAVKYREQQLPGSDSLLNKNPRVKKLYQKFDSLYNIYYTDRKKLDSLQNQTAGNHNLLQAAIQEREAAFFKKNTPDSLADSVKLIKSMWGNAKSGESFKDLSDTSALSSAITKNPSVDSQQVRLKKIQDSIAVLKKQVDEVENKIVSFQKKMTDSVQTIKQNINKLNSPETISDYVDKNDTTERNRLTKAQKFLLSVDQIGIGRSWINYSELTVKNVSLNGVNIEMNPGKLYVAGAIGSVNNQFRDFVLNNNTSTRQSVKLVRLGVGKKNKNNLIFTLYGGHKALLNTTGVGDSAGTQKIMGASLAATIAVTKNITVTGEYARSSYSDNYDPSAVSKGLLGRIANFSMRTNEAWNLKFQSIYPRTNTKIDGSFTKMGAAFQSFTIYASNVKQDAYLLHVNQLLWKKKLSVDASIRKNDFNSALTTTSYSNTTVFKSIQVSLAIPRYPFVSVGYYPTSQLFVGSGNTLYQSWYNTLNTIASYSYKLAKLNMSSNAVYTKFYNNQSDTSFAYFNASTFTFNQSIYLAPFIFQGNLTVTDQEAIHLVTFEPLVTYKYKNILSLTGGATWSRLNGVQTLWGGTAGMSILLKNIGTIQLNYEKVHLPAYNGTLMPVDMGRITFNKVF